MLTKHMYVRAAHSGAGVNGIRTTVVVNTGSMALPREGGRVGGNPEEHPM